MPTSGSFYPSSSVSTLVLGDDPNILTRKALRRYIAGPWGLGGLFTGTASNGASLVQGASLLVDQSSDGIQDTSYDSDRFEHAWLYKLAETSGGAYRQPESHRVASYSPNDGSISIGRNFLTTPVTAVSQYELHYHGIATESIHEAISWACQMSRQSQWIMLGGLAPDGDMQAYDTSAWGTVSGLVVSKVSPDGGRRILRAIGTTATAYVPTAPIAVIENRTCRIYALVTATGTAASVVVRDLTHSADIAPIWVGGGTGATTGLGETFLAGTFRVPVGCTSIEVRLRGGADWEGIAVHDSASKGIRLPDWLTPHEQTIIGISYLDGVGSGGTRQYHTVPALPEPRGTWLEAEPGDYPGPIVVQAAVPYVAPDSDDDTLPMSARDYLATGVLRFIYTSLARPKTIDTARFETQRVKVDREWQAYQRSRNPLASKRNSWGRR